MGFKTILAIVGGDQADKDIAPALSAAREVGAHLSVVVAGVAFPPIVGDYPVGTGWLEQRDEDLKTLKSVQEQISRRCNSEDLSYDVQLAFSERAFLEETLFQRALYCDLVIIGQGVARTKDLLTEIFDAVVFHAHRPLVLVPADGRLTLKPKRIVLAWNSTVEAARAAREALDLLVEAEQVNVTIVDPDVLYGCNGGEPGADAAAYFARHNVNVVVDQLTSARHGVKKALQQHAVDTQAELVVMGAYGHSRMRQRIFGGVTASTLEETKLPVLLAR